MASQLIEEVTAPAQSDSVEDAREICADGSYFPNNLCIRSRQCWHSTWCFVILIKLCVSVGSKFKNRIIIAQNEECDNSYVRNNSKQSLIPTYSSLIFTFVPCILIL